MIQAVLPYAAALFAAALALNFLRLARGPATAVPGPDRGGIPSSLID